MKLPNLLNINCEVKGGILQIFWSYSTNHYYGQTIEEIAHSFLDKLKQLIKHCCQDSVFWVTLLLILNWFQLQQKDLDLAFGSIPGLEDIYPLSPMQSGLMFRTLYAPESDAYFVQTIFEFEGFID